MGEIIKQIKGKVVLKSEYETGWNQSSYIPEVGELVFYKPEIDENGEPDYSLVPKDNIGNPTRDPIIYTRQKNGDGVHFVRDLPFYKADVTKEYVDEAIEELSSTIPGQKVENGGEIFNDYMNNVASGEFSHAEGRASVARTDYSHAQGNACIAGGRGFQILSKPLTDPDSGEPTIKLNSVVGLEVGDTYSMKFGNNFIDFGMITNIYPDSNSVVVDYIPTSGMNASTGVFWIGRKQLGTDLTKVAFRNKDYDIREIDASADDFDAQVAALKAEDDTYTLLGCGTKLLDSCQHAEGTDSIAVGYAAHAEGNESIASGRWSHAEGNGTYAGYAAHSEGNSTKATGEHAHAEGGYTEATAGNAHAEGYKTKATGAQAHAAGQETTASGKNSYAGGRYSDATGFDSFAHGESAKAEGAYSVAMGRNATAKGSDSVALGLNVEAAVAQQIVVGQNNAEDTTARFIVGIGGDLNDKRNGLVVKVDGRVSAGAAPTEDMDLTTKEYVVQVNRSTRTDFNYLLNTTNKATRDLIVGKKTTEGGELFNGGKSAGKNSHAEGNLTIASGEAAHAEGYGTTASGDQAHAEGHSSIASGDRSHAEGWKAEASGIYTHAEGFETKSTNWASHAEGNKTVASGAAAHAEGSLTTAKGGKSHAGGQESAANGDRSFVHGLGLIADATEQAVFGRYNAIDKNQLFIIGNGSSVTEGEETKVTPRNVFTVDGEGRAVVGEPTANTHATTKKYVDDKISQVAESTRSRLIELVNPMIDTDETGPILIDIFANTTYLNRLRERVPDGPVSPGEPTTIGGVIINMDEILNFDNGTADVEFGFSSTNEYWPDDDITIHFADESVIILNKDNKTCISSPAYLSEATIVLSLEVYSEVWNDIVNDAVLGSHPKFVAKQAAIAETHTYDIELSDMTEYRIVKADFTQGCVNNNVNINVICNTNVSIDTLFESNINFASEDDVLTNVTFKNSSAANFHKTYSDDELKRINMLKIENPGVIDKELLVTLRSYD